MSSGEFNPILQWEAKLEAAEKLIGARETVSARVALEDLIQFVTKTWGANDIHLIRPYRLMAASYFWESEPLDPRNGLQVEYLRRALTIARLKLGDVHFEVAALAGEVGAGLVRGGSIDEGCDLMSECLAVAAQLGETNTFSRYFDLIGHARMGQGRLSEALASFERAVSARRREASTVVRVIAHYNLGRCLRLLGRSRDALVALREALEVARSVESRADLVPAIVREIDPAERGVLDIEP
jgi:tetratricopeptide (TPR) repeat protein